MPRLPPITVLRDRYVPTPEHEDADADGLPADAVNSVPFGFAMGEDWPTDAHCVQYENVEIDGIAIRLGKGALEEGVGVQMVWLIGDVDAPDHTPTPEWREETGALIAASPFAWYATKGGYRVIAKLAEPLALEHPHGHREWHDRYLAWCDEVLAEHGIELDRQANDWTRLFRLPRVVRDGRPTAGELHGEPPDYDLPEVTAATPNTAALGDAGGAAADRAIATALRMPASVEGHGGDRALYNVASELATLLESAADVEAVLVEVFNPRCLPPWDARKLEREARQAVERARELGGTGAWARRRADREERDREERAGQAPSYDGGFDLPLATSNKGVPLPTLDNVLIALESWFGEQLWLNEMGLRVRCENASSLLNCPDGDWRDNHTTALHAALQRVGIRVTRHDVKHALRLYAGRNQRNPLAEELADLAEGWDRVGRVDTALADYWGCADTLAVRAASRVSLLSLAARGMVPGAKVDTCLVLVGEQGTRKSTSLRALAIRDEWFGDSDLPLGDKDARILLQGKWLWEVQEMASMHKREAEQVKAFISQSYDTYRAPWGETAEDVPRTCVLFGTSNRSDILQDPTGARRFMPVVTRDINTEAIARDRDQLLGEAAARVLDGERHWPTADEALALRIDSAEFAELDPWIDAVQRWLRTKPERRGAGFTTPELFSMAGGAVALEAARQGTREARRMAGVLRRLGFKRIRTRRHGKRDYVWLPEDAEGSTEPEAQQPNQKEMN